jgi:hypothetical protein
MVLFTLWDARGRRLPYLIALVLVLGGYAAADAVAAPARSASVTNVDRVFLKSTRDAKARCKDHEIATRTAWRCEGWWGGSCVRPWLTRPNYVFCGGVEYFMDHWDAKAHLTCARNALYYGGAGGTAIRLVSAKRFPKSRYRTTAWGCTVTRGLPS